MSWTRRPSPSANVSGPSQRDTLHVTVRGPVLFTPLAAP